MGSPDKQQIDNFENCPPDQHHSQADDGPVYYETPINHSKGTHDFFHAVKLESLFEFYK